MKRTWRRLLGTLAVLASAAVFAPQAQAADHLDAPAARADGQADINDLYVFRSTDTEGIAGPARTTLVMTVQPLAGSTAAFSDAVSYNFHIVNQDEPTERVTIACTATAGGGGAQRVTCEVQGGPLNNATVAKDFNDATDGSRVLGNSAGLILFAGMRNDPFFFDLGDFQTVYASVLAGTPDPSPLTDDMGEDFFDMANTLAIVVDFENNGLFYGSGPTPNEPFSNTNNIAVWAETVRLGTP